MIKGQGSENTVRPNQLTFDIESLKSKTNTELLAAMDEMLARPAEEIDGDFVDACLDILQDRAPVEETFDPREALDRLHGEHPALFEEEPPAKAAGKKRGRPFPLSRYMGIAAAAVLCLVVTANAFGYNPIQALFRFFNDTIQIFSNPSGVMELPPDDPSQYHSLEEALKSCGASTADCITWIPKDYSVANVQMVSNEDLMLITAVYVAERGEIAIRIIDTKGVDLRGTAESDLGGSSYEKNGTTYYITSNYDLTKAGWYDETYSYVISGQVSEYEMRKILDSIT